VALSAPQRAGAMRERRALMRSQLRRPSPALVISLIALFVALGGSAWAITIGSPQIRNNGIKSIDIGNGQVKSVDIGTGQARSVDLADNGVTGTDINEGTLGPVPSAARATSADHSASADRATSAAGADVATNLAAGRGNAAFTTTAGGGSMPSAPGAMSTLNLPAGTYWIVATFKVIDLAVTSSNPRCGLVAEGDHDLAYLDAPTESNHDEIKVTSQLTHVFSAPGQVTLQCEDAGIGDPNANTIRITALQLGSVQ
jgi:hypothetical protein